MMKVLDQATYIEPSFDLRAVRKELDDPKVPEAKKRPLRSSHQVLA